jgi:hypothetical protein
MARFIYPKIQTGDNMTEEDLTTYINGERTVFTLANSYEGGTLRVYWNGQRQVRGETFTETTNQTFTTTFTPNTGDFLIVDYTQA